MLENRMKYLKTLQLTNNEGVEVLGIDKDENLYIREDYWQMTFMHYKMSINGEILEKIFNEPEEPDENLREDVIPFKVQGDLYLPNKPKTLFPFFILPRTTFRWAGPATEKDYCDDKLYEIDSSEEKELLLYISKLIPQYNQPGTFLGKSHDYSTSEIRFTDGEFLITRQMVIAIERKKKYQTIDRSGRVFKNDYIALGLMQYILKEDHEYKIETYRPGKSENKMTGPKQLFEIKDKILVVDDVSYRAEKNKIHIFEKT